MYLWTNNGVGISEMLIFSDSATTTPRTRDTSFTIYFAYNVEFSIKANLEAGMLQFLIHTMVAFDLRMSHDFDPKSFWQVTEIKNVKFVSGVYLSNGVNW